MMGACHEDPKTYAGECWGGLNRLRICGVAMKLKNGRGRPTLYPPEMGERLEEAMAGGLSVEAAAAKIGISARSLFNWQKIHPEFMQSTQECRLKGLRWWKTSRAVRWRIVESLQ